MGAAGGEIIVERRMPLARGLFHGVECVLGAYVLWFLLRTPLPGDWQPAEGSFLYCLGIVMGGYWILHGGWQLYTGLSAVPQIETSPEGMRLFRFVRFFIPWENVKAVAPAFTGYIGPGRNVLPGDILPYGAHAKFKPPISKTRRFVAIELEDPGKVSFDSPLHRLAYRFQFFNRLYKYSLKHCQDPEAVTRDLQERWRRAGRRT